MLANLSFKTKLLLLLVTAVLGFIIVTFVAMKGLSSQQGANNDLRTLSNIQASNDQLSIHMLEIADKLRSISVDNYADYVASANQQIEQNNQTINANIQQAHSLELQRTLEDNLIEMNHYSQALMALIGKLYIIGFDSSSGLRGSIDKMGLEISDDIQSLSLLKREFTNVRKAEASYLSDPKDSTLAEFNESFSRFDNRIENFGFQDTHGIKANAYRDALIQYGKEYQSLGTVEAQFTEQKARFNDSQLKASQLIEATIAQAETDAEKSSNQANITLLSVSTAVIIFATLLMVAIGRSVNMTLHSIMTDLNKVKKGTCLLKP